MTAAPLTVVVGAGISGLACAYSLQKSACEVLVLEASSRPGGMIQSVTADGYLFETGPQSFNSTPLLDDLCADLSLDDQRIEAPHGLPRFVLGEEQLVPVPMSPPAFLSSSVLDWKTKFSILTEVLRTSHPPEPDESIAAFTRRKFSAQLLDRLVGPFVSGIYAGDPEQISLRAAFPKVYEAERSAGSIVRGMFKVAKNPSAQTAVNRPRRRPSLISFQKGNQALVSSLAAKLGSRLYCNAAVASIAGNSGQFTIHLERHGRVEEIRCDLLVLATPTKVSAQLLGDISPDAASTLMDIPYAPVSVVSLAYRRDQVGHSLSGFGFLIPRSARIRTLGTVWNSSLFPKRAPAGQVLLTSFIGGATDRAVIELSDEELSAIVSSEVGKILDIRGKPALARITRMERAIPQYNLGHTERLQAIRGVLEQCPGLWLTGNYWEGPAVGSCIEHAVKIAQQVRKSLES